MSRGLTSLACLLLCLLPRAATAHPTAASDVVLTLDRAGSLNIAMRTNARALVIKLEALAEVEPADGTDAAALQARIAALDHALLRSVWLVADGRPVPLTISAITTDGASATVHLEGTSVGELSAVTWRTDLIFGSYPFVIRRAGSPDETFEWLLGRQSSTISPLPSGAGSAWQAGLTALRLGFVHVVPRGLDHVLFVLGLLLLAARVRPVLIQVSVFTLAHSATLALTMLGIIALPAEVVEPLIALSIVCVAVENLVRSRLTGSRLALVFGFGLLHGMGFAGALADLQLPMSALAPTLVGFNVGVELGQLTVVGTAGLLLLAVRRTGADSTRFVLRPASIAIGLMGLIWTVDAATSAWRT